MRLHDAVDITFMTLALDEAKKALALGEIPVGAIVINDNGEVVGAGYNTVEQNHCQSYHAEANAIKEACSKLQDWRLNGCTLYVTLEPCLMCINLIGLSRCERVVFGARSPVFGYSLDKEGTLEVYKNTIKEIKEGVLADEAAALLQDFFKLKREKRRE